MQQLLRFANEQYNTVDGCGDECNCQNCIRKPFYDSNGNEKYDCLKGLAYYVMDYGPCYASSAYHFFRTSHILRRIGKKKIKILSIGCGFSPDYYALKKIIQDEQLDIDIDYIGIEQSERWNVFHNQWETPNKKIENIDVLSKHIPNFYDFDIIIMDKFFSTLSDPDGREKWIKILRSYVQKQMKSDAFLIFKDVNDQSRGRDLFDKRISPLFDNHEHYKTGGYGYEYTEIANKENVFTVYPENLNIYPRSDLIKEVFFVYEKKRRCSS